MATFGTATCALLGVLRQGTNGHKPPSWVSSPGLGDQACLYLQQPSAVKAEATSNASLCPVELSEPSQSSLNSLCLLLFLFQGGLFMSHRLAWNSLGC